jgi:hypothetical protein
MEEYGVNRTGFNIKPFQAILEETAELAQLIAEDPALGSNIDLLSVNQNRGALGQTVFRIATTHAETVSDATTDAVFWNWVMAVNAWLTAMGSWQVGLTAAFTAYAPVQPAELALKSAVLALPNPGPPPAAAPASQRGRIE